MTMVQVSLPQYEPLEYWAKIPLGITFRGDATSVAVDSSDNVYVFNRGSHPLVVLDPEGKVIRWLQDDVFIRPHGVFIDRQDNIYLVDDGGHFVQKRSPEGTLLWTLGQPGIPAPWQEGEPFNKPTDVAVHPVSGDVFITDGYGNSRVHKFDSGGKHIFSWGRPGTKPGEFSLPHNIAILGDDRVVVADRENFRLQIFTLDGEFVDQHHVYHPMSVTTAGRGKSLMYVGEMGPPPVQHGVPNLGNRITIMSDSGERLDSFGASLPGNGPDQFVAPHGIAVDSKLNVYIAEVAWTYWWSRQPQPAPGEFVSLRKWIPKKQ